MAKVIFLLGLAGSGKSFYAEKLKRENGAEICEGIAAPHHPKGVQEVIEYLNAGKNCTVEEIAYCFSKNRDKVVSDILSKVPNAEIEWLCLENDLESANWNVERRTRKNTTSEINAHLRINENWHNRYTYPENTEIIPIKRMK